VDAAVALSTEHGVPSIFATARGDLQTRRRAARAKPVGWVQMPYSPESLIVLVNMALAKIR